jgi:hypothetical protein
MSGHNGFCHGSHFQILSNFSKKMINLVDVSFTGEKEIHIKL